MFFAGFAPWSFTWPYALWKYKKNHTWPVTRQDTCAVLLTIYAAVVFVFFNIVATKYTTYTYPMVFSLSILTNPHFYRTISAEIILQITSFRLMRYTSHRRRYPVWRRAHWSISASKFNKLRMDHGGWRMKEAARRAVIE